MAGSFVALCLFTLFGLNSCVVERLDIATLQTYVKNVNFAKHNREQKILLGVVSTWVDSVQCQGVSDEFEQEFRHDVFDFMTKFVTVSIVKDGVDNYIGENPNIRNYKNGQSRSAELGQTAQEYFGKLVGYLEAYNCTANSLQTTTQLNVALNRALASQNITSQPMANMTYQQLKDYSAEICFAQDHNIPQAPISLKNATEVPDHETIMQWGQLLFDVVIADASGFEKVGQEVIDNITQSLLDYVTESRNKDAIDNMTSTEHAIMVNLRHNKQKKIDQDVSQVGMEPVQGSYSSVREFFYQKERSWKNDVWTRIDSVSGPSKNSKIASIVFGALTSMGSTMVIGGATMGPIVQGVGGGILGVGQLGSTAITLFEMFNARPDARDIDAEFWTHYKQFIDSPLSGVRKCMSGVGDNVHVQMAYRSEMDDKPWMDSPKSVLIIQKSKISHDMSSLFLECFSGKLRMLEGDISAFSHMIMSKDGRQLYRVDYSGLSNWWDMVSLTCGKEVTLEIEFIEPTGHMMFFPGARTGDYLDSWNAMSDSCIKDPLKRIEYMTSGCKYDPMSSTKHQTSCSVLYDMSVYDNIKKRFVTVSGILDKEQSSVKVFEFYSGPQAFTLDTTTVDGQSKCLKLGSSPKVCHWPELVTVRNITLNKTRSFNVKLAKNTKFGLTCSPGSQLDYNGTCKTEQVGKETWEITGSNCQVQCFKKQEESDVFMVKTTSERPKEFEIFSRFGADTKVKVTDPEFDPRTEAGLIMNKKITMTTVFDFGQDMISLRSGNNTWKDMVLTIYGCQDNSDKCTYLMNGTWTQKNTKHGFGEVSESLTFEFKNTKQYKSCSGNIRMSDQTFSLVCSIKDFDHTSVMVVLETGTFFCDQDNQDRTCETYNNGDVVTSGTTHYIDDLSKGKLYGIVSDVMSGAVVLRNSETCIDAITTAVNKASALSDKVAERQIRDQVKDKCGGYLTLNGALPSQSWCCNSVPVDNRPITWKPVKLTKYFDVIDVSAIKQVSDPVKVNQDVYLQILSLKEQVDNIEKSMSDLRTIVTEYSTSGIVTIVTLEEILDDFENHEMYKNQMVNQGLTQVWHAWLNITATLTEQTWTEYIMARDYVCCGWNGTSQEVIDIYGSDCKKQLYVYQTRVCMGGDCVSRQDTDFVGCRKHDYSSLSETERKTLRNIHEKTDGLVRQNSVLGHDKLVTRTVSSAGLNKILVKTLMAADVKVDMSVLVTYNMVVAISILALTGVFILILVMSLCKRTADIRSSESGAKLLSESSGSDISLNKNSVTV